jgi:hypothetical protein
MAYHNASKQTIEQMTQTLSRGGDWHPTGYDVNAVWYPGVEAIEVTVRRRDATGALAAEAILYAVAPAVAAQWLFDHHIYLHPAYQ